MYFLLFITKLQLNFARTMTVLSSSDLHNVHSFTLLGGGMTQFSLFGVHLIERSSLRNE